LEKTVGADGKARKQRKKPSPEQVHERSKRQAEKKLAEMNAALDALSRKSEPIESTAEAEGEAMKAKMAALDAPPIAPADAPTPEAPSAPAPTTTEAMIQDAAAKSENERNEITQILDARLPRLLSVDKARLFAYIINHPALADVKVPKREKVAA
jgi:hypothetical protein